MARVFVCGATGFLGRAVSAQLIARGHAVTAVVRTGSASKVARGVAIVNGNPLDRTSFADRIGAADTFLHLVGVHKPAPWKEKQFRAIDLVSVQQSVAAVAGTGIQHFVYVSVAQPAPVMKSYIRVRQECEALIRSTGIPATFVRPWYVLGPGRQWPLALIPLYRMFSWIDGPTAERLGLVALEEMVGSLVWAVENPGARVLDVPAIRRIGRI
jgi:uncharacterized protein YbjT (DUF2867 family)